MTITARMPPLLCFRLSHVAHHGREILMVVKSYMHLSIALGKCFTPQR